MTLYNIMLISIVYTDQFTTEEGKLGRKTCRIPDVVLSSKLFLFPVP